MNFLVVMAINGNDAIELYYNNNVVDIFGNIDADGTNTNWEYEDGWAYRNKYSTPDDTIFNISNWYFSGPGGLEDETSNSDANLPFPIGRYIPYPTMEPTNIPTILPTNIPS